MNMKTTLLIVAIACFAGAATAQRGSDKPQQPMHQKQIVDKAPPAIGAKTVVQGRSCIPICHPICSLIPCCDC